MPKFDDATIELRRAVTKVRRLNARLLYSHNTIWLVDCDDVQLDKLARVLSALPNQQSSAPDLSFTAKVNFLHALEVRLIAAAQHAIKQLRKQAKTLARLPARALGVLVDEAWLDASQARVDQLSALLHHPIRSNADALRLWLNCPIIDNRSRRGTPLTQTQIHMALATDWPANDDFGDAAPLKESFNRYWDDQDTNAWDAKHANDWTQLAGWRYADAYAFCISLCFSFNASRKEVHKWWPQLTKGLEPTLIWPHFAAIQLPTAFSVTATRTYLLLAAALMQRGLKVVVTKHHEAMLQSLAKQISKSSAAAQLAMNAMLLPQVLEKRALSAELFAYVDTVLEFQGERALVTTPPVKTGIGVATAPEFAQWLNDEHTLDAYFSAQLALKQEPKISRRLLADFSSGRSHEPGAAARTQRRLQHTTAELILQWRMLSVDAHLRTALGKILGTALPVWSEDWRDAARLYFGLECNQKALKILLIAAVDGRATALRTALPCNAQWLAKAGKHFSLDAWLNPPDTTIEFSGKRYSLHAERDPLQALRMGLPFHTCLSIDDGCNRFSAVLNAMDANKWVWYLRDDKNSIVARKLVAVSKAFEVQGFKLYCSIKGAATLGPLIDAHLLSWIGQCGLEIANPVYDMTHGTEPESLADANWYNDGVVAFETAASAGAQSLDAVATYCTQLGMPTPESATTDLRTEADLAMAARQGDLRALPRHQFNRPSEIINCQRLIEQRGEAAVARAYRAPPEHRLNPWAERQAFLAGPLRYWDYATQLDYWNHRNLPPVTKGEHLPLLGKMLTTLKKAASGQGALDDHGIEHATMYWIPQLLTLAPGEKVVALANEAASLWQAVAHRLEYCDACFVTANQALSDCLHRHWVLHASARDALRREILRAAQSRTSHASFIQVLLTLMARTTLQTDKTLHETVFGAAPTNDPAVLNALQTVVARHPNLAGSTVLFAARLRHSAPDAVVMASLHWPDTAPFDVLENLLPQHPKLMPALRRYAPQPDATIDLANKGLTYWLQRVRVGWHETLVERVLRLDENSEWAARALTLCGTDDEIKSAKLQLARIGYHHKTKLRSSVQSIVQAHSAKRETSATRRPVLDLRNVVELLLHEETLPAWAHKVLPDLFAQYPLSASAGDWLLYCKIRDHVELNRYRDQALPKRISWPYQAIFTEIPPTEQDAWLAHAVNQFANEIMEDAVEPDWVERLAKQFTEQDDATIWLNGYHSCYDYWSRAAFLRALTPAMMQKLRELTPEAIHEKNKPDANAWLNWRLETSEV